MFQAILIDLADVFAGRSSPESLGLVLELLIKRFLCYCVLSLDLCVINTLSAYFSLNITSCPSSLNCRPLSLIVCTMHKSIQGYFLIDLEEVIMLLF